MYSKTTGNNHAKQIISDYTSHAAWLGRGRGGEWEVGVLLPIKAGVLIGNSCFDPTQQVPYFSPGRVADWGIQTADMFYLFCVSINKFSSRLNRLLILILDWFLVLRGG